MQSAPSVVYPVGRSAFAGRLLAAVALLIAATMVLGLITADAPVSAWVAAAWTLAAWGLWAWRDARRVPAGWLRWQAAAHAPATHGPGQWGWQTSLDGDAVTIPHIEPVLDLQSRWLLRLAAPGVGAPGWVWVEASRAPADWLALRRALMQSRQPR